MLGFVLGALMKSHNFEWKEIAGIGFIFATILSFLLAIFATLIGVSFGTIIPAIGGLTASAAGFILFFTILIGGIVVITIEFLLGAVVWEYAILWLKKVI